MTLNTLVLFIALPLIASAVIFLLPRKTRGFCALLAAVANFILAVFLFKKELIFNSGWLGFGIDFSLKANYFSSFILLSASVFGALICLYSLSFLKDKDSSKQFYSFLLLSLGFVNGAVLADNLVVLLFFWEGLLLSLYGMIYIGGKNAFKTATKALVIVGISDLCMMAGIALTGLLAKTLVISEVHLSLDSLGGLAFILLVIGAISKAGSMPFHTWIPDAAVDAPLPFMAFFPAAIEKLIGIYFLTRITLDMFKLQAGTTASFVLMSVGGVTIILAVMMALIQKDYKRLLSYHAISQVGYMILGIGTCLPAGIIGGIFHMLNNAIYKCGLFLTAGSVEKEAGTTELEKLGGLRKKMPVTFLCFLITAASISGVPPFNGFFSKELIYDAALERGAVFYLMAVLGSFFTAASFLKLGHAAFLGRLKDEHGKVREAPVSMLVPTIILAAVCIFFGVFNQALIKNFIQPILGEKGVIHSLAGAGASSLLVLITLLVLIGAFIHHIVAVKLMGGASKAADHIHYAPFLSGIYSLQEKKYFDPYNIGIQFAKFSSGLSWKLDRGIDWFYETFIVNICCALSKMIRRLHSGYYVIYVIWALMGAFLVMLSIF